MLDMAVDLDAVTGGENHPLAPFGILGKLFECAFKGIRGKMQALPPFNWGRFMVQTDDNGMHRCSATLPARRRGMMKPSTRERPRVDI
jgi:hypothetical protein